MTRFTAGAPWKQFADEGWARACAETGFTSEDQCSTIIRARELEPGTVSEAIDTLILNADGSNTSFDLLRWIGLLMLEEVPADQRVPVLQRLGELDPPTAALIYTTRADLSDDEDEALRQCFYPSMPVVRGKDEEGTLGRAKGA